eukprot:967999-Amphidinium_carterae.1
MTRPLRIEFTSIQINVLEKGDEDPGPGVKFHRDLHNHRPSNIHLLTLGKYSGGRVWTQDSKPHGVMPSSKLLGLDRVPSDVRGRWLTPYSPGDWLVLDPYAFHAVEPVEKGIRYSVSVYVSGGLHRVLPHQWDLLRAYGFPVKGLERASLPLQCLVHATSQYQPASQEEVTAMLSCFDELPPNALCSGEVMDRPCLWLSTSRVISPHMRKSLSDMQGLGLVLWKMTGKEAFELIPDFRDKAEKLDLDLCQFPVYVLTSHDLVFPYSADSDEVHTLSKKARQEIVKQTRQTQALLRNHKGEKESAVYKQEEYIFPEYEDEDLEHEPEDIGGEAPGEPDWTPSESERQALQLAHNNLGHPRSQDFARLLRRGGVRAEIVRWASRHFSCPACQHTQRPVSRLPAGAPKTFSPNMVVGADVFHMEHPLSGANEPWLHIVDWGTGFQTVERIENKESGHVFMIYSRSWVRLFGHPATLVVDAGTEFQGVFALACGQYGTLIHTIDTNTPWLNARTERSHGLLRDQVALALEAWTPLSDDEYLTLVYHSTNMMNQHSSRGGYSPVQRVLGYMPSLPESILSDEVRPAMIMEGPLDAVRRSEHLRDVAREAWAKLASRSRLLRAMRSKNRGPVQPLKNGDRVWVWREGVNSTRPGSWQGPGSVVCVTPTGAFVSLRGQLWKVNSRNLRQQESEDQLADQMVSRYLTTLRNDMSSEGLRSQRKFVDCTRDVEPESEPGEPQQPQQQAEQPELAAQEQTQAEIPEEERAGSVRAAPDEHPEAPPAARPRVQEQQGQKPAYRGAETLMRSPSNSRRWWSGWTEVWFDGTNGEAVTLDIKKGTVLPEQLAPHLRDLFIHGSRLKEEKMVKESLRPLSEAEACKIEQETPDQILPSRWLDVWKSKDEPNQYPVEYGIPRYMHAKSRWILQGFRDPSLLALSRSTPGSSGMELLWFLQVCADHGLEVEVADFAAAFCQTDMSLSENQRSLKLYARLPPQKFVTLPGTRIVELLGEIYGLSSAPQAWRNTLLSFFKAQGIKIHPMSASVFVLFEPMKVDAAGRVHNHESSVPCDVSEHCLGGIILLQVDDMLMAGNGVKFRAMLKVMQNQFKFGRWDSLLEEREFNGRMLKQVDSRHFTVDMIKAVGKLKPLTLPPSRVRPLTATATAEEITAFRGLLGSMMWCARCACPQGLAACSLLASRTSTLKVQDMKELNGELTRLQKTVGKLH